MAALTDVVIRVVNGVWLVADGLTWVGERFERAAEKVSEFGHRTLSRWAEFAERAEAGEA